MCRMDDYSNLVYLSETVAKVTEDFHKGKVIAVGHCDLKGQGNLNMKSNVRSERNLLSKSTACTLLTMCHKMTSDLFKSQISLDKSGNYNILMTALIRFTRCLLRRIFADSLIERIEKTVPIGCLQIQWVNLVYFYTSPSKPYKVGLYL